MSKTQETQVSCLFEKLEADYYELVRKTTKAWVSAYLDLTERLLLSCQKRLLQGCRFASKRNYTMVFTP